MRPFELQILREGSCLTPTNEGRLGTAYNSGRSTRRFVTSTRTDPGEKAMGKKRTTPRKREAGSRDFISAGGDYVGRDKVSIGGDYAGRDIRKSTGMSASEIADLFNDIYKVIDQQPPSVDRGDVREAVEAIKGEATKVAGGKEQPNETIIRLSAQNLIRMAPDILEVIAASLASPAAGVAAVIRKVIDKANASPAG